MKKPLSVFKIVSVPTHNLWSQVYNAGNLIAVISLKREKESTDSLIHTGKKIISSLEAEYFTLENKNLQSLKAAVLETIKNIDENIEISITLAVLMENAVYLIIYGKGAITLKRNEKTGILLENTTPNQLESASGFIQNGDIMLIQTEEIKNFIPNEAWSDINENNISDFIDSLSVKIERERDPLLTVGLIHYKEENLSTPLEINSSDKNVEEKTNRDSYEKNIKKEIAEPELEKKELKENFNESFKNVDTFETSKINKESELKNEHDKSKADIEKMEEENKNNEVSFFDEPIKIPKKNKNSISHIRRVIASIVFLIVVVFGVSIFFFIEKQNTDNLNSLFNKYYSDANSKYTEGQSLMSLNVDLAKDDFNTARNDLDQLNGKFDDASTQAEQITNLKSKIDSQLNSMSEENYVSISKATSTDNTYLGIVLNNPANSYTQDDKSVYALTSSSVISISKSDKSKSNLISKLNLTNPHAIGTYLGNIYILDNNGIYKYTPSSFTKSNYTASTNIDFSKATSLAIDGSIYVLTSDGQIAEFYKGLPQSFNISGLNTPLKNPTLIVTNSDDNNLYILDPQNQRIVVLDKKGNYKNSYATPTLSSATQMDVDEKNKIIYFLSGGQIYKLNL